MAVDLDPVRKRSVKPLTEQHPNFDRITTFERHLTVI